MDPMEHARPANQEHGATGVVDSPPSGLADGDGTARLTTDQMLE